MSEKLCYIFTGEPRLIDKNKSYLLDTLSKGDVYVVSDESMDWPIIDGIKYFFCRDYPEYRERERYVRDVLRCAPLLQWLKIEFFLQKVNLDSYDIVIKLRTDVVFPIVLKTSFEPNTLYLNSDYVFGGRADCFKVISGFFTWAIDNYYDNHGFVSLDLSKINDCHMDAGKFHWLKLPRFMVFFSYRKRITNLFIKLFSKKITNCRKSDSAFVTRRSWKTWKFMSEPAFLHYILNTGFTVKKISDDWIRLDVARHK